MSTKMKSEKASSSSSLLLSSANDVNKLCTEDCNYLLRSLELDAFSAVVSAMRAQGALTEYKEAVLDHLKDVFFVTEDRCKAELRRAANDQLLCNIAKKLNPSYDVYADWASAGMSVAPTDVPQPPSLSNDSRQTLELADQLLQLADQHNKRLQKNESALVELIHMPKKPYVPELLRPILRMSEDISSERLKSTRNIRKTIKAEKDGGKRQSRSDSVASSYTLAASDSPSISTENGLKASSSSANGAGTSKDDTKSHYKMSTDCIKSENGADQDANDRRLIRSVQARTKPRGNASCTCARVLPFVFPPAPAGQQKMKPPRGNPDRRTAKRPSPTTAPVFASMPNVPTGANASSVLRSVPLSPSTQQSSLARVHLTHHYVPAVGPTLVKRQRTSSTGEIPMLADGGAGGGGTVFARQITDRQLEMSKTTRQLPRGYVRPIASVSIGGGGTSTKFFVTTSQNTASMNSAYSNPARPYYGNPSAAAMGITVRSTGDKNDSQHIVGHDYSTTAPILVPAVNKNFRRPTTTYTKTIYSSSASSLPTSSKTFATTTAAASSSPARSTTAMPPPVLLNGGTTTTTRATTAAAAAQACEVDSSSSAEHNNTSINIDESCVAAETAR